MCEMKTHTREVEVEIEACKLTNKETTSETDQSESTLLLKSPLCSPAEATEESKSSSAFCETTMSKLDSPSDTSSPKNKKSSKKNKGKKKQTRKRGLSSSSSDDPKSSSRSRTESGGSEVTDTFESVPESQVSLLTDLDSELCVPKIPNSDAANGLVDAEAANFPFKYYDDSQDLCAVRVTNGRDPSREGGDELRAPLTCQVYVTDCDNNDFSEC